MQPQTGNGQKLFSVLSFYSMLTLLIQRYNKEKKRSVIKERAWASCLIASSHSVVNLSQRGASYTVQSVCTAVAHLFWPTFFTLSMQSLRLTPAGTVDRTYSIWRWQSSTFSPMCSWFDLSFEQYIVFQSCGKIICTETQKWQ